jgi:hypothetical protein
MNHPIHKYSALARPVEPQYPTNLAVIILLPIIAIGLFAWLAMNGSGMGEAGKAGLFGAGAAFLAWALGREMDPDHNATAFIAMALTVLLAGLGYGFDLLTLGAVLFAVRLVNRTVGPSARIGDVITLVLLNLGAVFAEGAWWMPFISVIALAIDEVFERSNLPQRLAIPALLIMGILPFFAGNGVDLSAMDTLVRGWIVTVVVIALMVAGTIYNTEEVIAPMDVLGAPCNCRRVQAGMALILLAAICSLLGGQESLAANLGILAVLAASLAGRNVEFGKDDEAAA